MDWISQSEEGLRYKVRELIIRLDAAGERNAVNIAAAVFRLRTEDVERILNVKE